MRSRGAVTQAKIAQAAQEALKGQTGAKGAQGVAGPQGPKGDTGAKGSDASALLLARVNGVPQNTASYYGSPSGTSTSTPTIGNVKYADPVYDAGQTRRLQRLHQRPDRQLWLHRPGGMPRDRSAPRQR
ncbi:MAG: hypothetical protein H0X42_07015 [Solirubrobacterales bacterium]|nr:hypothetical protein [Solirubrobacterales bacterium]